MAAMHSFRASTTNEMFKLFFRGKNRALLLFSALFPVLAALLLSRLQDGFGIAAVGNSGFPLLMLQLNTLIFLPLFIFMAAADVYAGEIGERSIKLSLIRPVSRWKIYLSKQLALAGYAAAHLLLVLPVSLLASLLLFGPGSGMDIGGAGEAAAAYFAAVFPLLTLISLSACISGWLRSSSGALTLTLLLYLLLQGLPFVLPALAAYLPTAYLDWHSLWIGAAPAFGRIISIFMFLAACSILFLTVGLYQFDKKEM